MSGPEIATALVIGRDSSRPRLNATGARVSDLPGVLERVLVSALERPPCLVGFSGGRDSAGVLALAVRAARRHGLPPPIPATNRFPGIEAVDETGWQELIVKHLGVEDWLRIDVTDELDLVGPIAGPLLRRFGVVWPPNSHFLQLLAPHARGGTLVTGVGGDELLEPAAPRGARLLAREVRPARGDLRAMASVLAPRWVRRRRQRARLTIPEWLRPAVAANWADEVADLMTDEPLQWGKSVLDGWWRSRARLALVQSIAAVTGLQTAVSHPFMHPEVLRAVAGARWRTGFTSRTTAMNILFGDLLPASVRARQDKAVFFEPFVNRHSRVFMETWDGRGVDPELVDIESLRRIWREPRVDAR
ncbi:MAG: asparagine synthase-related protein, partial [Solirubrobacteraceae bacterium]